MLHEERIRELEIAVFQLEDENRRLDRDNHCMKGQLKNANEEIKKLRRIIEKKNKQLSQRRKERYKNQKR